MMIQEPVDHFRKIEILKREIQIEKSKLAELERRLHEEVEKVNAHQLLRYQQGRDFTVEGVSTIDGEVVVSVKFNRTLVNQEDHGFLGRQIILPSNAVYRIKKVEWFKYNHGRHHVAAFWCSPSIIDIKELI